MGHISEVIDRLRQAASDGRIDLVVTERAPGAPAPAGPPGYTALLTEVGRVSCHREFAGVTLRFAVVDEKGATALNGELVHPLRDGVSTAHLVAFAEAGDDAAWCFDITDETYPVYYVHRDEPRARLADTGEWENPADAPPDFPSFDAWLDAMADAFTADPPPRWFPYLGQPGLAFT
ncbi:hypothetical protein [Umezawaea sp.]|uniref:hypothetical protein n=1 Tax=Umezawaea sp. TaxID=1955258 RepID=UPI002ED67217